MRVESAVAPSYNGYFTIKLKIIDGTPMLLFVMGLLGMKKMKQVATHLFMLTTDII